MLIAVEDATSTSRRPAVQPWLVQDRDFAQLCALFPVSFVLCICIRIGRSCSACSLLNRKTKIKYIISVELLVDCARMSACVWMYIHMCVCVSGAYPVGNIIYRPCMKPVERCWILRRNERLWLKSWAKYIKRTQLYPGPYVHLHTYVHVQPQLPHAASFGRT